MTTTTKAQRDAQAEAIENLRALVPAGATVYTDLVSVATNGMSRHIRVLVPVTWSNGEPGIRNITNLVGRALGIRVSEKDDSLVVSGTGMDMGFHVVYNLSSALHRDGYSLNHRWI